MISLPLLLGAILLGHQPLLFVDDSAVASREGLVRRLHQGRLYPEPIIAADRPWEGQRVYIFGSVFWNPEKRIYEMWYQGSPGAGQLLRDNREVFVPGFRQGGASLVLYATSRDGKRWEKPGLGIHRFKGSAANNIVFDLNSPSLLIDAFEKDPSRRYKMLGTSGGAYWSAVSPDGLHWRTDPPEPILPFSDTITLAQDPRSGDYLAFHKRPREVRGYRRRVVWLARSRDFVHWSEPELVLQPDAIDDAWVGRPRERTEFYNASVFSRAEGLVAFLTVFRVQNELPRSALGPGQSPVDGPIDVEIASSPDAAHWTRSWPRMGIIPHGDPGAFNGGAILGLANTPVNVGDETRVYYTVLTTTHGAPIPPKRISIAMAIWRRDGFVSLDSGPQGARLETVPLRLGTGELTVNVDARRGELRAAVLDEEGKPLAGLRMEDCVAVRGDSVAAPMRWSRGVQPPTDRPVKIVLKMSNCRLYGLSGR